jgi:hypothetical protein
MTHGGRVRDLQGIVHEWKPRPVGLVEEEVTNCGRCFLAAQPFYERHGEWTYTDDPITCPECK